ncbi:MAG: hypothetical protein H6651_03320 [Ardenticatenales bacterium]|nr:hypothetical protein [Ardenticatenales bacterium]
MMAIEQIWERYRPVLLPFIRRRVPDEATAEDILQEVFVRVVAGWIRCATAAGWRAGCSRSRAIS